MDGSSPQSAPDPTSAPVDPAASSVKHTPAHLRFWLAMALILGLDLWSKAHVFATLPASVSKPFIPGVLDLHRSLNAGAVFGLFTGQTGLFVFASIFAFIFVIYLFWRTPHHHWITQIALGLILAGALGNLYDRIYVQADVVRFTLPSGQEVERIGMVVEETDERITVGDWPNGEHRQVLRKDEVDIRQQGVVRDFLRFTMKFPEWVPRFGGKDAWPWVFNVADTAIVVGVIALLLSSWFEKRPEEEEES